MYTRQKWGFQALPDHLSRVRIEHKLPETERFCACGSERYVIGEQLDIIPARVQVLQHVRKQYACRRCESGVETAPFSSQPLPKSNIITTGAAGAGLYYCR